MALALDLIVLGLGLGQLVLALSGVALLTSLLISLNRLIGRIKVN